jgi:hypothetical protein
MWRGGLRGIDTTGGGGEIGVRQEITMRGIQPQMDADSRRWKMEIEVKLLLSFLNSISAALKMRRMECDFFKFHVHLRPSAVHSFIFPMPMARA